MSLRGRAHQPRPTPATSRTSQSRTSRRLLGLVLSPPASPTAAGAPPTAEPEAAHKRSSTPATTSHAPRVAASDGRALLTTNLSSLRNSHEVPMTGLIHIHIKG